jgi:hypothetical protein
MKDVITKFGRSNNVGNSHISIFYPGLLLGEGDSGVGSIGRIDQANISSGTTIKMHPHINDEILSYFRVGSVVHSDSTGFDERIGRGRLMLMKAGKVFFHEEKILDRLEGLQIFIRPGTADYEPEISFLDLEPEDSINEWRLLASYKPSSSLRFTSKTEIYDISLQSDQRIPLPLSELPNQVKILYVFQGEATVNNHITLNKGEGVIIEEGEVHISASLGAEVVLFVTDRMQDCYKEGMFSGMK